MNPILPGIHHVTAITADAQKNIDFYTGVLGLRMVKLTVNYDDPGSYHLYYGDETGSPGTILTFFAWPDGNRGRIGTPQVTSTAFAVPGGSLATWGERLKQRGIATSSVQRFGAPVLLFVDPDGMQLELIESDAAGGQGIRGFHSVTLSEEGYEHTARMLTETMGFRAAASEQNRFRYHAGASGAGASGAGAIGTIVDLLCVPDSRHGGMGAGIVHHVAFRTPDDAQQLEWRRKLVSGGSNVSPVMDRNYFHSLYYREPGGVLFEIATDGPGMAIDEPADALGSSLRLPKQYEPLRKDLENYLPKLRLPGKV